MCVRFKLVCVRLKGEEGPGVCEAQGRVGDQGCYLAQGRDQVCDAQGRGMGRGVCEAQGGRDQVCVRLKGEWGTRGVIWLKGGTKCVTLKGEGWDEVCVRLKEAGTRCV